MSEAEIESIRKFLTWKTTRNLKVDRSIKLETKPSTFTGTTYQEGKGNGVFTTTPIKKFTVISKIDVTKDCSMNDGLVDLTLVLNAKTHEEMYTALVGMRKLYFDPVRAEKLINVRATSNRYGDYYEAIKDISAGSELFRAYGFSTWVFDIPVNKENIGGFCKFLGEYYLEIKNDPFKDRIEKLLVKVTADMATETK